MITPRSCVGEDARFIVGIHKPGFEVKNLRNHDHIASLGQLEDGTIVDNSVNFPDADLYEPCADIIYEIANPFPFRGTTYINSAWADVKAEHPETIGISKPAPCSLLQNFEKFQANKTTGIKNKKALLDILPHPLTIALAQASTDPEELMLLAKKSCRILFDPDNQSPAGIGYTKDQNDKLIPEIHDHELFEVLVNNRYLPDDYKNALVLKPGVQGNNEITGEYLSEDGKTHVFEYLRRNSYIPWGHFASNMANDAIRYRALDLCDEDMKGIRHLYYQRAFVRVAAGLGICLPDKKACLTQNRLEDLRKALQAKLNQTPAPCLEFDNTLWGWNFGFGYAQSGHRLHASHQMIHQQNAMIPKLVQTDSGQTIPSFSCGDLINDFIRQYKDATGKGFFKTYLKAIKHNTRTDGKKGNQSSLILMEDDQVILFVPKAQISEWELQLMPKIACGNIIEADIKMRNSLDQAILTAVKTLESLGANFVTSIEFSKRFDSKIHDQHMLYSFIPRLPYAPDTFSEAQLRWISGCYPEDFAHACRMAIKTF
ncbi:hypothetical protein [Desulfobacula toluolica]|uniref:Conserved uncharacterized protein n=1 Tax=Desulfobacula toluolica (strain DSM 7467 / Tol2) TaxID=651182 RepID=K0NIA7_DESTT|nr:hypothetical protein [Desulfobacula toluolica]CCK78712.1 conserved uncharacterized protein [Desulfobacula toluolica Tol2]